MKIIGKIFKTLIWILLLVLLLFNVYSFVTIRVLGNDLAVINGKALVEVISGSMEPTIDVGDLIIIDTKKKSYSKDDIITFRDVNDAFVTHRIIEVVDEGFITKGDANNSKDKEIVTKDKIVGVYCFRIKKLGVIITAIRNPLTFVFILIIGIILCVLASTDKDGNVVDVDDDYLEFLEYKKNGKTIAVNNIDDLDKDISEDKKSNTESKSSTNNNSTTKSKKTSKSTNVKSTKGTSKTSTKKTSSKTTSSTNKIANKGSSASKGKTTNSKTSTTKKKTSSRSGAKDK